jgi:hypothetical protein
MPSSDRARLLMIAVAGGLGGVFGVVLSRVSARIRFLMLVGYGEELKRRMQTAGESKTKPPT